MRFNNNITFLFIFVLNCHSMAASVGELVWDVIIKLLDRIPIKLIGFRTT